MKRGQKSPAPVWAMSDKKLAHVVATFLERRACVRKSDDSIPKRIRRAEDRLWAQIPELERRLKSLVAESQAVAALSENGVIEIPGYHPDLKQRAADLERAICSLGVEIRSIRNGVALILAGIIYRRYRQFPSLNSVDIAAEFGLSPELIRQILLKLNQIGTSLYGKEICSFREINKRKFVSFEAWEGEVSGSSDRPLTLAA